MKQFKVKFVWTGDNRMWYATYDELKITLEDLRGFILLFDAGAIVVCCAFLSFCVFPRTLPVRFQPFFSL